MSIQIHILEAGGGLKGFQSVISDSLNFCINKVSVLLPLPDIDVVVEDNPGSTIPQTGVAGFAPTQHLIHICIDPKFKNLNNTLRTEIVSTTAHELHHCAREASIDNPRKNLLEALITDGLADHFDIEVNGIKPRPWSVAVTGEKLMELLEKARPEFQNEKYNHSAWFFGSEDGQIPMWTGYSLGFELVGKYLRSTGKKASELYNQEAKDFLI